MASLHSGTNINIQDDSDFIRILNLFTRNYKVFILCILIALVTAFIINRFSVPVYRASSSLMILEKGRQQLANVNEYINSEMFGLNQGFQNELYVVRSTPVIEQTVKNLDLTVQYYTYERFRKLDAYKQVPFKVLALNDHIQPVNVQFMISISDSKNYTVKAYNKNVVFTNLSTGKNTHSKEEWSVEQSGRFDELLETQDFAFIIQLDNGAGSFIKDEYIYGFEFRTIAAVTNQVKSLLEFRITDRDATVIEISMRSTSPIKGIDIVNELMDVYSTQNVNRKNHIANVTIDYIERQLSEISNSLSQTEDALQQFRSSRQLLNVTDQASGMSEQYLDLQNKLAELMTRKRYYDYLAEYMESNRDFSDMIVPSAMGIQDEFLNTLVGQLISFQAQRSNLILNRQEKNPLIQRLEVQIENTKNTIFETISSARKTTDISIDEMNKRINRVRSDISSVPRTQRQLSGIERNYRLNDAIYTYLLEKRAEAKISQASNLPDNVIIEPARVAGMVSPNPKKNYIIALAFALILPFAFFYLKSMINDKIEHQERIDNLTDALILGKIPYSRKKINNVVFEYPRSTTAEAYRALRTNIEYRFKDIQQKIIIVSSSLEGEGKSFTALNLAMSYAQLGLKTILADFDLRKPTGYFTEKEIALVGLTTYFEHKAGIDDIIQKSPHSKLDYVPSGPIPPNPVEMLASEDIRDIIEQLKERYECIIIDSTPLAQVSDAYLLMDLSNIRIIVARYNFTLKRVFSLVMKDLKEKNIENACVVMNDNRMYSDQYGYGYGYDIKKKHEWRRYFTFLRRN